MCRRAGPESLRLIAYTRYGPMVGCLRCGVSTLIRDAPPHQRSGAQGTGPTVAPSSN